MLDYVHFSARFLSKLIVVVVEAFTMTKNTEICPERRSLNIHVSTSSTCDPEQNY